MGQGTGDGMGSSQFKLALGCSVGVHVMALLGLPVTEPVAFDVDRGPSSVELYLLASPQPVRPTPPMDAPIPPSPVPPQGPLHEAPTPIPQTVISEEQRGALTEALPGYLRNPPPVYPTLARERGEEGTVLLEVEVLASGRCGTVAVLESSGHALLDEAAVYAVRQWVFKPARRWHQPVPFWVEIPITFRLVDVGED